MEGILVAGQQNAHISDTLQRRDVAMATISVFPYTGCTLAPPGEYEWTVHVQRRCGLMSNYFDHLFYLLHIKHTPIQTLLHSNSVDSPPVIHCVS